MFIKATCQFCKGHIEYDSAYSGFSVKCPHCSSVTKLVPDEAVSTPSPVPSPLPRQNEVPEGPWVNDPMSDKQRAMLILHGVKFREPMTKGEASRLIDEALRSSPYPTNENQTKAAELFWKIRLNELVKDINDAITIVGDETATITKLRETKKAIKLSVSNLTDIIDKRIETKQFDRSMVERI